MGAWEKLALDTCKGETKRKFEAARAALIQKRGRAHTEIEQMRSRTLQTVNDEHDAEMTRLALIALRDAINEELRESN